MTIDQVDCEKVIRRLIAAKAEFADLFFEERTGTAIVYENKKADRIRQGIDRGVGIRIIRSSATLYAYSTEVTSAAIDELVSTLLQADPAHSESTGLVFRAVQSDQQSVIEVDPADADLNTKMALLAEADETARSIGNEIHQVRVIFSDECRRVVQVNSEGARVEFYRAGLVFAVHVTARRRDLVQTGYEPVGGQVGLEFFRTKSPAEIASVAASRALMMLGAREAPSGRMPVVLHSDAGGTMVHEAVGHGLEADFIGQNMSVYAQSLGKQVAAAVVSVVDDPTVPNLRGSYPFDDEGTPSQRTVLVEKGELKGFLYDRLNAMKQGTVSTGNGRRESYRHKPIPRMSNTMILPGATDPEQVLKATPSGLLVKRMGGGQVNPVNGDFVFEVAEGYLIENGCQGEPVRGATLVGNGPQVLRNIDMVANDLGFGIGTCGKDGQGAPVSDAQPTLRIGTPDQPDTWITVGGTAPSQ
ncbi:MAG: TldD/PmbA family protein [Desulfomonilaceae bacterium]